MSLDILDHSAADVWSSSGSSGIYHSPEARIRAQVQAARESVYQMSRNAARVDARDPDIIVVAGDGPAGVLRRLGARSMVLEVEPELWVIDPQWLSSAIRGGSNWMSPGQVPLQPRTSQTVELVARALTADQRVVFWPSPAMFAFLFLLENRGVPLERLERQVQWAPATLPLLRPYLDEWFALHCPSVQVPGGVASALSTGRSRWAMQMYEGIFPVLMAARQARDGVQLPPHCPRAVMNLLIWLRDGGDTALRAARLDGDTATDAGLVRCSSKTGMLLSGVTWKVVAAEEEPFRLDEAWIGHLFDLSPRGVQHLVSAGWSLTPDDSGQALDLKQLRNECLARTQGADVAMACTGIADLVGERPLFSPELLVGVHGPTGEIPPLMRRGVQVMPADLAQSTGASKRALEAVCARLSFFLASQQADDGFLRKRIRVTLQRARGAAEMPPPVATLIVPSELRMPAAEWVGAQLQFRWGMPIDRRRRDLSSAIAHLDDSLLLRDTYAVSTALGSAAMGNLVCLVGDSVYHGNLGEGLGGYLWANFSHLYQPEYIRWVRSQFVGHADNVGDLSQALRTTVNDLVSVLL